MSYPPFIKMNMKSILQSKKECLVCKRTTGLHEHHVFEGTANRKKSEKDGLKVYLCPWHHNASNYGVHFNKTLDLAIKQLAQREYEKSHTREEFIERYGKNYLDSD